MTIYQNRSGRDYDTAAICRRGHVETSHVERRRSPLPARCDECGASILTTCPSCSSPLRGSHVNVSGGYEAPDFCIACGAPMPWASRQARLYQLENILYEQPDLTDADRLVIREQIEALSQPDLTEEQQSKRWKILKELSPTMLEAGKEIIVSVTTSLIQKQLGIKP